ncbi:MAG: arylsulfatase [Planctomycetota bacterium]|jgi:arylsulfatase A-like enzyme|nr:arylsulfatase [Planctomycetota bacterium]
MHYVAALLLLSASAQTSPQTDATFVRHAGQPNIIFIMADQMRADFLGCADNASVHSPNLDRIAAEGAHFRRAYSSTPSCTPARAAVLTGQAPWNHGMLGYSKVAERYSKELPRLMESAGYFSWAIGKNHFHPQRNTHGYRGVELDESGRVQDSGFVSDYRQWFARVAPKQDPDATGIGWNEYPAKAYVLDEKLHPTTWTGDRAVAFLQDYKKDQPFFLKVSFARPHSPYDPPQRFLDAVDIQDVPDFALGAWSEAANGNFRNPDKLSAARNNLGKAVTMESRRAYAANIAFIDEQVGRILASLEQRELLEDTLIIFTSDHGDMLGDHHLWRKTYAYEGSAGIPMLMRWGSKTLEAPRGQNRDELVELRDLLPTFLDAAGAKIPDSVDGRSLLDPVSGRGEGWRDRLDLEHSRCYWAGNKWTALVSARWKYIFHAHDGSEQLFDLVNDPKEQNDLATREDHQVVLEVWRGRMANHLEERGEQWVKDGAPAMRKGNTLHSPNYPPADWF